MSDREVVLSLSGFEAKRAGFSLEIDSWQVEAGAVVGVVGPNGAGKSTLLASLVGLFEDATGGMQVLGLDPRLRPEQVRSRVGLMSNDIPLYSMQIGALLRMVSAYYRSWDPALVDAMLQRFDLSPSKHTKSLSTGQGTRLRILLAMAFRPEVLILDEPSTGLDVGGRRVLSELIHETAAERRTVILSSHLAHDVERLAEQLLVLNRGKVVAQGTTEALVGDDRTLEEAMRQWENVR